MSADTPRRPRVRAPLAPLAVTAALLVVGCGDTDSSASSATGHPGPRSAAQVVELTPVKGELRFARTSLRAKAGRITLRMTNPGLIPHNIAIRDDEGRELGTPGELVTKGGTSETKVDLRPGTYEYYCAPHASTGMTGTLTVS